MHRSDLLPALLLALSIAPAAVAPAWAQSQDPDIALARGLSRAFSKAAEKALPSVVAIQALGRDRIGRLGRMGEGSGWVYDTRGRIVTNHHVVAGATQLRVELSDGRTLTARLLGTDQKTDLAVLQLEGRFGTLTPLKFGDSKQLRVAEWVIALGNPFGLGSTVTVGVVSAKRRSGVGINDYEEFIQTDAAINPGNSGGPLIDLDGRVVGVNSAILSRSGGYQGIGFAIPVTLARPVIDQLVRYGKVRRGRLGVRGETLSPATAERLGVPPKGGALITDVPATLDSPARKVGLRTNDVIVAINREPIRDWLTLRNRISLIRPGSEVTLTVLRPDEERAGRPATRRDVKVRLGELLNEIR